MSPAVASGTFSILERIDVGETVPVAQPALGPGSFSILERIDVGETVIEVCRIGEQESAFSILERIDVGETADVRVVVTGKVNFQYPRTDRRG